MKKVSQILVVITVLFILFGAYGFYVYKSSFGTWKVEKLSKTEISWADFIWVNSTIDGRYIPKTAMLIPCKLEGITNSVCFQFDLGANVSMLYEKNLSSFYFQNPSLAERVKNFGFPVSLAKNKNVNIPELFDVLEDFVWGSGEIPRSFFKKKIKYQQRWA